MHTINERKFHAVLFDAKAEYILRSNYIWIVLFIVQSGSVLPLKE